MKMINNIKRLIGLAVWLVCTACASHPEQVTKVSEPAPIYPDYADVTIPYNIAPLNFLLRNDASALQVTVSGQKESLTVNGDRKVCFPLRKWKNLLETEKGQTLTVTVTARVDGKWLQYPAFTWQVAPEKIDGFLSYRLIEPGYEVWNTIQLRERNIESFEEKVIADNNLVNGSCHELSSLRKAGRQPLPVPPAWKRRRHDPQP